jgi:hypothetical protein
MVRDHPTVGQVYIFLKLHRNHLVIDLYNRSDQPIPRTFPLLVIVVAEHLYPITYFIGLFSVRSRGEE